MSNERRIFITGGTGFLGMALAETFLQRNWRVVLYDVTPLPEEGLLRDAVVILGDIRDFARLKASIREGDVVVHAAAALPIRGSQGLIFDVNINGTRNVVAAAKENGAEKVIFISSTAVYGVSKTHPTTEEDSLDPMGHYGVSKTSAEAVCEEFRREGYPVTILRPKTFLGPGRLGIFQILFEWIYQGSLIYIIGKGTNRYQLLALSDLLEAIWKAAGIQGFSETLNIGAEKFGTVREDLEALITHAGSISTLFPLPAKLIQGLLRFLEITRVSPLVEWHYRTASEDSFVSINRAKQTLEWTPQKSNVDALIESYDPYCRSRLKYIQRKGDTHTVSWDPKLLRFFQIPSRWIKGSGKR